MKESFWNGNYVDASAVWYNYGMNCQNIPLVGALQTLSLNRGTLLGLRAQRKDYEGNVILEEASSILFVVKKRWDDQNPVIKKTEADMTFDEEGYYHFKIYPEDTENLNYGKYVWDFTANEPGDYRAKPAHGYLIVGNSAGWIINQQED